ncbi:MAG: GspH/FimT family pseudopilin [Tepidisphaeraceae bacterium]
MRHVPTATSRRFSASASCAFTLMEMAIVLIIISIVAMLVVPMVGNRASLRLSAAARKVMADLQYAQSLAISTQQTQYVRFSTNQYELLTKSGATFNAVTHPIDKSNFTVVFNGSSSASATRDLARVSLDTVSVAGTSILCFDSLGTPQSYNTTSGVATPTGANVVLTLRYDTSSVTLTVAPYTGEITVSN